MTCEDPRNSGDWAVDIDQLYVYVCVCVCGADEEETFELHDHAISVG